MSSSEHNFVHVERCYGGYVVAVGVWDEEAGGFRTTVDLYFGCQDRGCIIAPPKQGTNGGCRCLKDIKPTAMRIQATHKIRRIQATQKIRALQNAKLYG